MEDLALWKQLTNPAMGLHVWVSGITKPRREYGLTVDVWWLSPLLLRWWTMVTRIKPMKSTTTWEMPLARADSVRSALSWSRLVCSGWTVDWLVWSPIDQRHYCQQVERILDSHFHSHRHNSHKVTSFRISCSFGFLVSPVPTVEVVPSYFSSSEMNLLDL